MRIATWNLAGRWSDDHARLLDALDADVLLLTEVSGRVALLGTVAALELQVPTANLPHQIDGLLTIDHIMVPSSAVLRSAARVSARVGDSRLSDHDAYVVELA